MKDAKIEYEIKNKRIIASKIFDNLEVNQLNKCININNKFIHDYNPESKSKQLIDEIEEKLNIYKF